MKAQARSREIVLSVPTAKAEVFPHWDMTMGTGLSTGKLRRNQRAKSTKNVADATAKSQRILKSFLPMYTTIQKQQERTAHAAKQVRLPIPVTVGILIQRRLPERHILPGSGQ